MNKKFTAFLGLEFCFLFAMWLSKTAWPLWVNESGDVKVYGATYSVMALVGMSALGLGAGIRRIGSARAMRLGAIAYGAGIALRWFDTSWAPGIASGILAGLGASTLLLVFKTGYRALQGERVSASFIAARRGTADLATGAAGLVVSGLLYFAGFKCAMFAALIPLAFVWVAGPRMASKWESAPVAAGTAPAPGRASEVLSSSRLRRLLLLSALGGLFTSLLVPYFPAFYKSIGMRSESIAILGTIATVASLFSQPLAVRLSRAFPALSCFVLGEAIFIASIALLLVSGVIPLVPILVAARGFGRSVSNLSEEILELGAVRPEMAADFYGWAQTAFLLGDSLGGVLGGLLISVVGTRSTMAIGIALVAVHVVGMIATFKPASVAELGVEAG